MGTVRMGVFSGQGSHATWARDKSALGHGGAHVFACLLARRPAMGGAVKGEVCAVCSVARRRLWTAMDGALVLALALTAARIAAGAERPRRRTLGRRAERERESEVSASMRGRRRPLRLEPGGPVGGRVVSPDVASAPLRSQPKLTHPSRPATRAQPKAGLSYATHNCWLLINTP